MDDDNPTYLTDRVPLNKFGSASWLDDYTDDNSLGEIIGATRTFTDGTLVEYPCNCEPTGDLNGFVTGIDSEKTPLTLNDNGIPEECPEYIGPFDTGYELGYDS